MLAVQGQRIAALYGIGVGPLEDHAGRRGLNSENCIRKE
jgi:hypothetical protein